VRDPVGFDRSYAQPRQKQGLGRKALGGVLDRAFDVPLKSTSGRGSTSYTATDNATVLVGTAVRMARTVETRIVGTTAWRDSARITAWDGRSGEILTRRPGSPDMVRRAAV
jgi:hypothetical protein